MNPYITPAQARVYGQGVLARSAGRQKEVPALLDWQARSWWLAGWNDQDIAMKRTLGTEDPTPHY